ncbi:MAG: hypothetical protein RML46_07480, partial [Anaerolineae bacterium]|nr:hypothetical protein [Anaerolineae bacterium]
MRWVKLSALLALVVVAMSLGLAARGRSLLRRVEGPPPTMAPAEPFWPETPMPTANLVPGVLA